LRGRGDTAPAWLKGLREEARANFERLRLPTVRQEARRFTNVAPIADGAFRLADGTPTHAPALVTRTAVPDAIRIVLLNGRFAPELSRLGAVPAGLKVGSLATAIAQGVPECKMLGQQPFDQDAFSALNTAFLEDGALVSVRKGAVIDTPVHIVVVNGG